MTKAEALTIEPDDIVAVSRGDGSACLARVHWVIVANGSARVWLAGVTHSIPADRVRPPTADELLTLEWATK